MTVATRRRSVLPAGPKLAARRRAERRERRVRLARRAGFTAAACVPVLLLGWLALSSPALDVDRVQVSGSTSAALVQDVAAVRHGMPLVRVDTDEVRRRVATLAGVAQVSVRRDWPGTLRIDVVQQVAVASAARGDGTYRLLAADGTPFATVADRPPGGVTLTVPAPGPSPDDATTRAALTVLAELSPELRAQVVSVRGESPRSVVLLLKNGRRVLWGPPGGAAEDKSRTVLVLRTQPGGQIDVTSPGLATVQRAER